ncbi:MAG: RIP metalloprotease RseP [Sandaracinaceae bacterium]|nr:RIP metalloprotease RseP [Sandaracinaceae bacterium]
MSSVLHYAIAILGISLLVIVHEAGHYAVARLFGMRVLRFSVGFGPPLIRYQPKNSPTIFQVCAIPVLAYVQIAGMNPAEPRDPNDTGLFPNKSLFARIMTIFAGPLANYLLAAIFIFGIALNGWPKAQVIVNEAPRAGTPSALAGLEPGDQILRIGTKSIKSVEQILVRHARAPRADLDYTILRHGREIHVRVRPDPAINGATPVGRPHLRVVIGDFNGATAPARQAGLLAGDRILRISGHEITSIEDVIAQNSSNAGRVLDYNVRRNGRELHIPVTPRNENGVGRIGAVLHGDTMELPILGVAVRTRLGYVPASITSALKKTVTYPYSFSVKQLEGIVSQIQKRSTEGMSSIVGMTRAVASVAESGARDVIFFLLHLSIAVGFFNLLPFPALDGGRLIFLLFEAVTRKRPNEKFEAIVHTVGIVVLLAFVAYITIVRDFSG